MISIIVPIYNVSEYLARCIESICAQSYTDLEIILVDDGSTDGSSDICDQYTEQDSRIKVIHKVNGGLVSARKAGVATCAGEYIGFVDGDDWIEKSMVEALYCDVEKRGADIVIGGVIEDAEGECHTQASSFAAGIYRTEEERAYLYRNMLCCEPYFVMGILPYFHNKLFHRDILLNNIYSMQDDIRVGEDAAVVFPALLQAKCIAVQSECYYHYCLRRTSMIHSRLETEKEWYNAMRLYDYMKKQFGSVLNQHSLQEQLQKYTLNNLIVRAYERCGMNDDSVLPLFPSVKRGDSIVIYGAGAVGKAIYQFASTNTDLSIVGWADQKYVSYRKLGYEVDLLDDINMDNTVKIVIAILRKKTADIVKKLLLDKGVDQSRIAEIDFGNFFYYEMFERES